MIDGDDCGAIGENNENLPQTRSVHHRSLKAWSGIETGLPQWEAGD
jgi:hypothetical protein